MRTGYYALRGHGKENFREKFNKDKERLRYLLDFLLNLYVIALKKEEKPNKKKLVGDFASFLTMVFAEIMPFAYKKKLGVKDDYGAFADYTLKLIKRDFKEPSLLKK
jgi:hypothetical protein